MPRTGPLGLVDLLLAVHPDPDGPDPHPDQTDPTAVFAALYPTDCTSAQLLLAATSAALLTGAGHHARVGRLGDRATCEVLVGPGVALVLLPLADLDALDAELALEDDADPAVWHVLARDTRTGLLLEPDLGVTGCPSVLWATRAGIDPAVALWLVDAALADPDVSEALSAGAGS